MYAASAIAANTIMRSACGAAAPLFTVQMFHSMGVGGGGSLVGGVAAVLAIIPFMFYKYGAAIRARSRFNPRGIKPPVKDEEANPTEMVLEDPDEGDSEDTGSESSGSSTMGPDEAGEKGGSDEKHHSHNKSHEAHADAEASASTEKVKSEDAI